MTQIVESRSRQTALVKPVNPPTPEPKPIHLPLTFGSKVVPLCLVLDVGENGTRLQQEVANQVIVGRSDLMEGHIPDLDLGPYGGQDYGVSRRHAVLYIEQGSLYIRDLASTNGTRVNGYPLEPDQPYKLGQGDEIELGHLRVMLNVLNPSA